MKKSFMFNFCFFSFSWVGVFSSATADEVPQNCYTVISSNQWGSNSEIKIQAHCPLDFSQGAQILFQGNHSNSIWGEFPGGWMDWKSTDKGYVYAPTESWQKSQRHILNSGDSFTIEYSGSEAAQPPYQIILAGQSQPPPQPLKQGSFALHLESSPFKNTPQISAKITNLKTHESKTIPLSWDSKIQSPNLDYGTYSVTLLPEQISNGIQFSKAESAPNIEVNEKQFMEDLAYGPAQTQETKKALFKVDGLEDNQNAQLNFKDQYGNVFAPLSLTGSKEYSYSFPLNDPISVSISSRDLNSTISESSFSMPAQVNPILIHFSKKAAPVQTSQGRIIGYLATWKPLPDAQKLAQAGYTHVIVAFGLFDTKTPGKIQPTFEVSGSTIDPKQMTEYIANLHANGVKVLLSIGGAQIPDGMNPEAYSVNFHDSFNKDPAHFQTNFIQSAESLMTTYGFDGFDFDIEQGFNVGENIGTVDKPKGDIPALANIINGLYNAENGNVLLSLAPQADNVVATRGFNNPWASYSSLIMQTHSSLSWVAIQLYNSGGITGIDNNNYGNENSDENIDFSTVAATALLESWPTPLFQPYVSLLKPDQVVLGYPAWDGTMRPDGLRNSDGGPAGNTNSIKKAINCLTTGTDCRLYTPPRKYIHIGGVMEWELSFDSVNNFKFASELKDCVINGNCSSGVSTTNLVVSPYKDVGTNMNWYPDVYKISTKVSSENKGPLTGLLDPGVLPEKTNTVTWAFAVGECGSETWVGVSADDFAKVNVPYFESNHKNFILSTGGAGGTFTCSTDAGMDKFIQRYMSKNLTGLDFDIENGQNQRQIQNLINEIAYAQNKYPNLKITFTLATLGAQDGSKSSLNSLGDLVLNTAQNAHLKFNTNLMTMDYGEASPSVCVVQNGKCEMYQSAAQAVENFHDKYNIPYNQIEVTPDVGNNDIADEFFTVADAKSLKQFAVSKQLGGLHFWSLDRDTACSTPTTGNTTVCSTAGDEDGSTQNTFDFLNAFQN